METIAIVTSLVAIFGSAVSLILKYESRSRFNNRRGAKLLGLENREAELLVLENKIKLIRSLAKQDNENEYKQKLFELNDDISQITGEIKSGVDHSS